jgi:purine nucleosidase
VTLVGIGPMTNSALAMRLEPRLAAAIAEIVIMGGSIGQGKKSPAAESNALQDPHAMFGLDVTHNVLALPDRLAMLTALDNPVARTMATLMDVYTPMYRKRFGWAGGAVHDLCTIAWLLDATLFDFAPMTVRVDTNEGPNLGRTICDSQRRNSDTLPTIQVAHDARADRIFALLAERLARYG